MNIKYSINKSHVYLVLVLRIMLSYISLLFVFMMFEMFQVYNIMTTIKVNSDNVTYTDEYIESKYDYQTSEVRHGRDGTINVTPVTTKYTFRTQRKVPKLGLMLVGWGGNNGSTVTAAIVANKNKMSWHTKEGLKQANYFGSITQSSTVSLGTGPDGEVYIPMKDLLPMVDPNDIVIDGRLSSIFSYLYLY